jgi:exodeoxyribonuclease VII large subunit
VLKLANQVVDAASERLRLLDPATTMARGWSIVRDANGKSIKSVAQMHTNDLVAVQFADGSVRAEVQEVLPGDNSKGSR